MELKLSNLTAYYFCIFNVLIVPYGIEMTDTMVWLSTVGVLIVPYGIEILKCGTTWIRKRGFNRTLWNWNRKNLLITTKLFIVLIVPYGIEILCHSSFVFLLFRFNRTLWNWNVFFLRQYRLLLRVLIVPYGIEITHATTLNQTSFRF